MKNNLIAIAIVLVATMLGSCNRYVIKGNWIDNYQSEAPARGGVASFQTEDYGYVALGYNYGLDEQDYPETVDHYGYMKDMWRFEPKTNGWKELAPFPGENRTEGVCFEIDGVGYIGLGRRFDGTDHVYYNDFYKFTPPSTDADDDLGTWEAIAPYPGIGRYGSISFVVDGEGYVGTGASKGNIYHSDFFKYNPSTNTWTKVESTFPHHCYGSAVFTLSGVPHIISGFDGTYLPNIWQFDPTTKSWEEQRKLDHIDYDYNNIMRRMATTFVLDDKGYIVTGDRGSTLRDCWEYRPAHDEWEEKTEFEGSGRSGAASFNFAGVGYVCFGNNGSTTAFNDLLKFYPWEDYNSYD